MKNNGNKPIKSELHHWWPRSLSKFWENKNGEVNQIFPDGRIYTHSNSRNYGARKNSHIIKLADKPTGFDENFENQFGSADNKLPYIVQSIYDKRALVELSSGQTIKGRFVKFNHSAEELDSLFVKHVT